MWKAGHSLIKAKMKEEKAALGGEMSGHIFFADRYFGYDDAIYAALRLLEILSQTGKQISSLLSDVPQTFATRKSELIVRMIKKLILSVKLKITTRIHPVLSILTVCAFRLKTVGRWSGPPTRNR